MRGLAFDSEPPIRPPASKAALPLLPNGLALSMQAPGLSAGLGGRLWPACGAMCRWLRSHQNILGKHVLELGVVWVPWGCTRLPSAPNR